MGLPVSSVIANIYMEYFEEITLGPKCPIPTPWWKIYVDGIISIVKKEQTDTLFNHLNSVDPKIKFTIKTLGNEVSTSFLDNKCCSNLDYTIHNSHRCGRVHDQYTVNTMS